MFPRGVKQSFVEETFPVVPSLVATIVRGDGYVSTVWVGLILSKGLAVIIVMGNEMPNSTSYAPPHTCFLSEGAPWRPTLHLMLLSILV
jgi:hypothetical protein